MPTTPPPPMTTRQIIEAIAQGIPGAVVACLAICHDPRRDEIVQRLLDLKIAGDRLWTLFHGIAGNDIDDFALILRAWSVGCLAAHDIDAAIAGHLPPLDLDHLREIVKFGRRDDRLTNIIPRVMPSAPVETYYHPLGTARAPAGEDFAKPVPQPTTEDATTNAILLAMRHNLDPADRSASLVAALVIELSRWPAQPRRVLVREIQGRLGALVECTAQGGFS